MAKIYEGMLTVLEDARRPKRQNVVPKLPLKSEARIQQDCVMWFKNTYPDLAILLFHIPNGEKRDDATAMKLKGMGVTKGVPDLFLSVPNRFFHGLYIEMKSDGGKPSKEQREFRSKSNKKGYAYHISETKANFVARIEAYLYDIGC